MNQSYTLESISKLTMKQIKQTYVYKNIPTGLNKYKLLKGELILLIKDNKQWFEELEPCMICYEQITNDKITLECCKKNIHKNCIDKCLKIDDRCPHCRSVLKSEYRKYIDDKINIIKKYIDDNFNETDFIYMLIRGFQTNMLIKIKDANEGTSELINYYFTHHTLNDDMIRHHKIWLWDEQNGDN